MSFLFAQLEKLSPRSAPSRLTDALPGPPVEGKTLRARLRRDDRARQIKWTFSREVLRAGYLTPFGHMNTCFDHQNDK